MNYIPISDARKKLPLLIKEVAQKDKRYSITVNGIPKAVLIDIEELESLQETANILAIPGAHTSIQNGLQDMKNKQGITIDDVINND